MAYRNFVYIVLVSIFISGWIGVITFSIMPDKKQKLINFIPSATISSPSGFSDTATDSFLTEGGGGGGASYNVQGGAGGNGEHGYFSIYAPLRGATMK